MQWLARAWASRPVALPGAGDRSGVEAGESSPDGGPSPALERNRIIAARREFAGVFADLARGKRNWQVMAFAATGLLSVVTVAYVHLATKSRFVPYVVEVDRMGQIAAAGPVAALGTPDERLVASELAQFVRAVRAVLPAPAAAAQAELIRRAYAFLGPEAAGFLNTYFAHPENDPRLLGARLAREVEVTGVLRVPKSDVWTLRWTETDHPIEPGVPARTAAWEAYVTVKLVHPTTLEGVQQNPLGLYVTSITWTPVGGVGPSAAASDGGTRP